MKKALLLPRLKNEISTNENLFTSPLYHLLKLSEILKPILDLESITLDNTKEYDVIISAYMGEEIDGLDVSKPIYEFAWDGLTGGYYFERYTFENNNEKPKNIPEFIDTKVVTTELV